MLVGAAQSSNKLKNGVIRQVADEGDLPYIIAMVALVAFEITTYIKDEAGVMQLRRCKDVHAHSSRAVHGCSGLVPIALVSGFISFQVTFELSCCTCDGRDKPAASAPVREIALCRRLLRAPQPVLRNNS